ncbi:MAG: FmdB family zinc ribbon protein [Syntrophobacteria bacterium]
MPIYEYECTRCGKRTEAWQKFSDPPVSICPHCRGPLHKLMSLNAFHLKGSGWYVTDYAGKSSGIKPGKSTKQESPKEEKADTSQNGDSGTGSD